MCSKIGYLVLYTISRFGPTHCATDKIVCILRNFARYGPGLNLDDIDVTKCTHLIYAHVGINEDGTVRVKDPTTEVSTDNREGLFEKVVKLRGKNPTIKILLSIGGWDEGCEKFSKVAASFSLRKTLVRKSIAFLHKYGFDGLDLDWEFPTQRGCGVADKMNHVELIKDLRKGLDVHGFLLTASVAAPKYTTGRSYDVPQLSQYLDLINILTLDFHGPWEERNQTGLQAPLHPAPSDITDLQKQQTVISSINNWIELGANPEIMILTIGFYGRTYTLANSNDNGIASPTIGPGNKGEYSNEAGILSYYEICDILKNDSWKIKWSSEQKGPYAYSGNQWIGYENSNSIKEKVAFAKSLNLAGVMAFTLNLDDFSGRCGEKFPLLNVVHTAVNGDNSTQTQHATVFKPTSSATRKVVCYVRSWAIYNKGNGSFDIENIDPNLCTHLIFCFMGINDDGSVKVNDPYNSLTENWGRGALKRFNELKKVAPGTKTLISIGGYAEDCQSYSKVAGSFLLRKKFTTSVIEFIKTHGFDGLDIDWEFPAQRGCPASDKENFVQLLKTLRKEFNKHNYVLTTAIASTEYTAKDSYMVEDIARYVDQMHLMAYDLHGFWDKVTGQNSPLYGSSAQDTTVIQKMFNINASVHYWLKKGAPPEKLILGIPFYGRTYTLANPNENSLGSPSTGPGQPGPYTSLEGTLGYNEICLLIKNENYKSEWSNEQKVPYAFKGNQWIGYDDERSVKEKVDFAKSMSLGGIMAYGIDNDDFHGHCGKKNGMLVAINNAL